MTEEEGLPAKIRRVFEKIPINIRKILIFAILFIPTMIFILKLLGVVGMMQYIQDTLDGLWCCGDIPYTPLIMWTVLSTISLLMTLLYITNLFIQRRDDKLYEEYENAPYEDEEETDGLTVSEIENKVNRFAVPNGSEDFRTIYKNPEPEPEPEPEIEHTSITPDSEPERPFDKNYSNLYTVAEEPEPEIVELTEEDYQKIYHEKTGKWAVWQGKVTKGYLAWKEEWNKGGRIIKIHEPEPEPPKEEPQTYQELEAEIHSLRSRLIQEHLENQDKMTKEEFVQQLLIFKAQQKQLAQQQMGKEEEDEDELSFREKFQRFLWKIKNRKKIKEFQQKQIQQREFDPNKMPL